MSKAEFARLLKSSGFLGASLDADGMGAVIYYSDTHTTKEEAQEGLNNFYNNINKFVNDSKGTQGTRRESSYAKFTAFNRGRNSEEQGTYEWANSKIHTSDAYKERLRNTERYSEWARRSLSDVIRDAVIKVSSIVPKIGNYIKLNTASADYNRLSKIGDMFDRMPLKDMSKPVIEAYRILTKVLDQQYNGLPVRVYPNNRPIVSAENIAKVRELVDELNEAISSKDTNRINEVQAQIDKLVSWSENRYDDSYPSSQAMISDVEKNNQMEFFTTGNGFGSSDVDYTGHPLLDNSNYYTTPTAAVTTDANGNEVTLLDENGQEILIPKRLVYNDVLRVVHDYIAHAASGASFGAKGEDRAWAAHVASIINEPNFTDAEKLQGIQALTSETRGQNTYVNFTNEYNREYVNKAREMRDEALKKGDNARAKEIQELLDRNDYTQFSDQKVGLLGRDALIGGYEQTSDSDAWVNNMLDTTEIYETELSDGNKNSNNVSEEVKDDFNSVLGISQQATSETDFTGDEGEANFNRWKGDNKLVSGSEVQDVKTGQPVVIKGFHGTTHEFYEFDSSVHGNIEGYLGKVNYFTTSESDADQNYQTGGADLTNRIESRVDEIESTLENEIGEGLEGEALDEAIQDVITENYPNFDSSSLDFNMTLREVAERIANNELHGGEDTTLEVYVKLNNPVVLGNGATWFDVYDISESSLEEAATEFAEENDITVEEAKEDYAGEIRERAAEIDGVENEVLDALSQALFRNGYDSSEAHRIMEDMVYEESVDLNKLEQSIRKGKLYENDEGEMASAQVISDMFQILGFDGIILTDVSERFRGMGLDSSTSHVHVFDAYNNQIKLSDGTNTTFGETSDIRFQADGQEVTEEKQNVANKILDYIKDKIKYFKDGNNIVVDAKEFANKLRELGFGDLRAMAWSKNFPIVIPQTNLRSLRNHPDYDAAKNKGDYKAAERVVKDIIKKDKINTILSGNKDVTIVPVLAEEGKGLNKLPLAYARELAKESNGEVAGISQTNVTSHTDSGAIERMFRTPNFNGEVIKGKKYLIVDDVVTSGSTVRALKEYIENNGGKVIGVSSLSNISSIHGGYSGNLAIKQDTIKKLREKFIIRQLNSLLLQYGIAEKYQDLTNAQAIYLLQFKDIDRLRDKFNDAGILSRLKRSGEEGRSEGETDRVREVSQENLRLLSTPQGDVYGFVHGGKMYLDPNKLTPDLVGEEFIHLQQQGLRLAAESGNKEAKRIVDAWDALTNDAAEAFMTDAQEDGISEETRALLDLLGIPYREMSADVYKRQDGESDADYKLRLQDEMWAKAQKKEFAERAEKLSEEGKLSEIGRKMYEAVKDFFRFINESLGLYNPKQWKNLSLSEIIDRI